MNRLDHLQSLLKESPEAPFLIYGIALEYRVLDISKALEYFTLLLEKYPDYLPTYYQAGQLYEDIDEDKALSIYAKGMELAKEQKNMHTYGELKSVFELLDM